MSINPVFDVTRFPANTNLPPHNYNFNPGVSSPAQPFQQNASIPFLSFPPPELPGVHHVFQSGPRFPGIVNSIPPASFTTNITPFTSVPPPPIISPQWNQVPSFNGNRPAFGNNHNIQMPSENYSGFNNSNLTQSNYNIGASSPFTNPRDTPRSFTSVTGLNPWAKESFSNNFHESKGNIRENSVEFRSSAGTGPNTSPWIAGFPNSNGGFNAFENTLSTSQMPATSPSSHNYNNGFENTLNTKQISDFRPLSGTSPSLRNYTNNFEIRSENQTSNFKRPFTSNSNNSHYPVNRIKENPSKFRKFNNTDGNNPWKQSAPISTGNKFQFSEPHTKQNLPNFRTSKYTKPNYNRRGANNFQNKNHHSGGQGKNFQMKGDYRPEKDRAYFCDTCDRSFPSDADLRYHLSEHIKCNARNCQFEAHPKIVALHKKMQHDTGYADAINKLKNDEEIEKWRAERRRRFPTAENILKRKAEQVEKEARGEVIENKEFGKFKRQRGEQTEQKKNRFEDRRMRRRRQPRNRTSKRNQLDLPSITVSDSDSDSDEESSIKLHKFPGMLAAEGTSASEAVVDSNCDSEVVTSTEANDDLCKPDEKTQNVALDVSLGSTDELKGKEISAEFSEELKTSEGRQESKTFDCVDINSEDESPVEIPINKVSSNDSACFPDPFPRNVSSENCNDEEDSDDDPPDTLPVSKTPLSEVSNSTHVSDKRSTSGTPVVQNDSDDEPPNTLPVSKAPLSEVSNSTDVSDKNSTSGTLIVQNETKFSKHHSNREPNKKSWNNRQNEQQFDNSVPKSGLLEKLLADDIRHERNVINQCIHFVIKKKFFGIGADI